ncbi:MAG: 16S rRNA (adenine(1518)-N(6)/adenine(1519)-N(6))-dimethyltransferase RsmA [Patescibacteria group bacterium]
MNLTSPKTIKELLAKYGAKPSKRFGQNFLIDKRILSKIIEAAEIKPTDTILEVGPGVGTLSQELAKKAEKVVAIEKDPKMTEILQETLKEYKNVQILQGDILKNFKFDDFKLISNFKFQISNYKVVANLPYYITSPVIRMFLEAKNQPEMMVLMVQKEVAQRICAKPPKMSLLSVSVQFYSSPKIISYVSKNCFWPSPKVDSAILKIAPRNYAETRAESRGNINSKLFFSIVRAGFSQPRKQLAGNFSKQLKKDKKIIELWLSKNNINPKQRAETLSIQDWVNLANSW